MAMAAASFVPSLLTHNTNKKDFELESRISSSSSSSSQPYRTPLSCRLHSEKKKEYPDPGSYSDSESSSGVTTLTKKIEEQISVMSFVRDKISINRFEDVSTEEEKIEREKVMCYRDRINNIITEPSSGRIAVLYMILNFSAILLSTVTFMMGTLPDYHDPSDPILDYLEDASVFIFSFDYVLRLIMTRNHRIKFALDYMNLIDILAIIPYYFELLANYGKIQELVLLRILRLFRVFRILKLLKYSEDVSIIVNAFVSSSSGLIMGAFVMGICSIIWAAAVFYGELSNSYFDPYDELYKYSDTGNISPFQSVPETLWFVLVTMTTVGYGDVFPITPLGKLASSFTMLCGVFVIAIPLSILATNFAMEFSKQTINKKIEENHQRKRSKKKKGKAMKLPLDRVLSINKILCEFKESVEIAKNRIKDFDHKFSKLESKIRGLRRHYKRQEVMQNHPNSN